MSTQHSIEVFPSKDGYRFRVRAGNGEVVATSEGYTREADAGRGARSFVAGLAALPSRIEITEVAGQPLDPHEWIREQCAEAWQRGLLYSYYQDRAVDPESPEAQVVPWNLEEKVKVWNPYTEDAEQEDI